MHRALLAVSLGEC